MTDRPQLMHHQRRKVLEGSTMQFEPKIATSNELDGRDRVALEPSRSAEELEKLVAERTAALVRANAALRNEIQQRESAEARLRQAQKMEAIGYLAGGIAHDFNNLLTVINGHCELLLTGFTPPAQVQSTLTSIAEAGERASRLTSQLLAFSRKQVQKSKVLSLNDLITDFSKLMRRLIGEDITLSTHLNSDLRKVKVDPGQIEQVLMNLVVNARDAMPRGGRLTIETANEELDASSSQIRSEVIPGRYAMFAVSDTGCGMDRATLGRLFEPFFTTKDPGQGTGLGLATAYGIVKQAGGYIYANSELGRGTCFKVYLPVSGEASSPKQDTCTSPSHTGTETVLIVEDEEGIRRLLRSTLERYSYSVLEAANGEEALEIGRAYGQPIDLVLTDVVMPEMGGRLLAERFSTHHPEARIVFMSGYTDDTMVRHGVLRSEVNFLQKPYTLVEVLAKVRSVLDQTKSPTLTCVPRSSVTQKIVRPAKQLVSKRT